MSSSRWRGAADPGGGSSWTGPGSADGSGTAAGTAGTAVDSDPATDAESTGVVLVDTELGYEGAAGAGTGIVLTADGEVLTNYHVVEGATAIRVTVASTGRSYAAEVVGRSAGADVALLRLDGASGLTTAALDDDAVAVGDAVTAVGNAGGTGTLTAADGTVTALDASITTAAEGSVASEELTGLVETDADVVPGDSGGPLLDAEGEVVGIDTAASSGGEIDGYAVPVEDALAVVEQITSGRASAAVQVGASPFLGVQVTDTATGYPGAAWGGAGAPRPRPPAGRPSSASWRAPPPRPPGWRPGTPSPLSTATPSPRPRAWAPLSPGTPSATGSR